MSSLRQRIVNSLSKNNPLKKWYYNPSPENFELLQRTELSLDELSVLRDIRINPSIQEDTRIQIEDDDIIEFERQTSGGSFDTAIELESFEAVEPLLGSAATVTLANGATVSLGVLTAQTLGGLGGATLLVGGVYYFVKGATLPQSDTIGPFNPIHNDLKEGADTDAAQHDKAFEEAETEQDIQEADVTVKDQFADHFLDDISDPENINAGIGLVGIHIKQLAEKVTGVLPKMPKHGLDQDSSVSSTSDAKKTKFTTPTADAGSKAGIRSGSAGGFGQDMGPQIIIPRPMNQQNEGSLSFHQVHRFFSRGAAFTPIVAASAPLTVNDIIMTTPLVEIPWDRAFMYLTPRDFNSLPLGSFAKNVRCKITVRNPQIAFETAASTSTIATLNHNKHMITSVGLNKRVLGTNRLLTFADGLDMTPSASAAAVYTTLNTAMYGVANSTADSAFNTSRPASLFGIDIELGNYFSCWNTSTAGEVATNTTDAGWPSLTEHIDEFNMNDVIGSTVIDESYTFICAPLKAQLPAIINSATMGSNSLLQGSRDIHQSLVAISEFPNVAADDPTQTITEVISQQSFFTNIATSATRTTDLLEQGSLCNQINQASSKVNAQPSIHVAMKPIPKLGGVITDHLPTEWTTVHAFYEVECFMEVGFSMPNHFSHGTGHNVELPGIMLGKNFTINETLPVLFNQYSHAAV